MATCKELAAEYRETAAKIAAAMLMLNEAKMAGNLAAHSQWCIAFGMYKDLIDGAKALERYG